MKVMGIPIPPEPDPFGNNDLACFPPGETPAIMYATFTGIEKGSIWAPGMPEPPNHKFELPQFSGNPKVWRYIGNDWVVQYFSGGGLFPPFSSQLQIISEHVGVVAVFNKVIVGECKTYFESGLVEPPNRQFIHGFGSVWHLT